MCFYIDSRHPNKKEAKKDITCYKILFKNWVSIINCFRYIQEKIYSDYNALNVERGTFYARVINRGYHSYSSKEIALNAYKTMVPVYVRIVVKCIIPKGSYYYYNSKRHEYVSNKIKITDIIKQ